jgi:hypothetical protein
MVRKTSTAIFAGIAVLIFGYTNNTNAGILNGHGAAISPLFTGSAPYNNGLGLSGSVDYAVFTAGAFNANFGGLGYVPGDDLVYTYQLNVTGTLNASAELVGIVNPANTIGSFNIGGVAPTSASFTPNARWNFAGGVPSGSSSYGLAFSSPNLPIFGSSLTFDGGTPAAGTVVPTPGAVPFVPEPASIGLVISGLALTSLWRRTRKQK